MELAGSWCICACEMYVGSFNLFSRRHLIVSPVELSLSATIKEITLFTLSFVVVT